MKIDSLMTSDGSPDFYDPSFRNALEALVPTFRASSNTYQQVIPPNYGIVYRAAFFDLLQRFNVKPCYHWFVMRVNNFFSPFEFDESVGTILMPSEAEMNAARLTWNTTQSIKT